MSQSKALSDLHPNPTTAADCTAADTVSVWCSALAQIPIVANNKNNNNNNNNDNNNDNNNNNNRDEDEKDTWLWLKKGVLK